MLNKIIVAVQKGDFDLDSELETLKLKTEKAGAVVIFVGKVRDLEDDNLRYLEIESFEDLAKSQIKDICDDIETSHSVQEISLLLRIQSIRFYYVE